MKDTVVLFPTRVVTFRLATPDLWISPVGLNHSAEPSFPALGLPATLMYALESGGRKKDLCIFTRSASAVNNRTHFALYINYSVRIVCLNMHGDGLKYCD